MQLILACLSLQLVPHNKCSKIIITRVFKVWLRTYTTAEYLMIDYDLININIY